MPGLVLSCFFLMLVDLFYNPGYIKKGSLFVRHIHEAKPAERRPDSRQSAHDICQ